MNHETADPGACHDVSCVHIDYSCTPPATDSDLDGWDSLAGDCDDAFEGRAADPTERDDIDSHISPTLNA